MECSIRDEQRRLKTAEMERARQAYDLSEIRYKSDAEDYAAHVIGRAERYGEIETEATAGDGVFCTRLSAVVGRTINAGNPVAAKNLIDGGRDPSQD